MYFLAYNVSNQVIKTGPLFLQDFLFKNRKAYRKGTFMKNKSLEIGFELNVNDKTSYTPESFSLKLENKKQKPVAAMKYFNDALVSMNYLILNEFKACDNSDQVFVNTYLQSIDPYFELYQNSAFKIKNMTKNDDLAKKQIINKFETDINCKLNSLFEKKDLQFKSLFSIIKDIEIFEKDMKKNLIYNFGVKFTEQFNQKLISLYSFLFHSRTLSANHYNQKVSDLTFESVRCDSINDYLAKTDFTVNDALIYWQFKKLSSPFINGVDMKIEKLFVQPLEHAFLKFNNNACTLINNLPEAFLTHQNSVNLDESLHQIQMDWLLGSACGLLFRIREELFGLQNGYDQIFWPESDSSKFNSQSNIQCHLEIFESDFISDSKTG